MDAINNVFLNYKSKFYYLYDDDFIYGRFRSNIVKHFKHKESSDDPLNYIYEIIGVSAHSENHDEKFITYKSLKDHKIWVRPYDMFMSEVDHEKYPDVKQKYRFESIMEEELEKIESAYYKNILDNF
jgi:hypothetical protein